MIHNLRKPGSYDRQYNNFMDDLRLQINNEQATALAVANRITGNTSVSQPPDRRTAAEKRLDLMNQTDILRANLLRIMDPTEVGTVMNQITKGRNPLKIITSINENFPGIQKNLRENYTDISPAVFFDFVTDYLASLPVSRSNIAIAGTKSHKVQLVDQIMKGLMTFHMDVDAILGRLRLFFSNGGKVVHYPGLSNDFYNIALMKQVIPIPNQATKDKLLTFTTPRLTQIQEVISLFPTLQQVNSMLNEYFNRNGSGQFYQGKTFDHFMRDVFRLIGLDANVIDQLRGALSVPDADINRIPTITESTNVNILTRALLNYINDLDIVRPVTNITIPPIMEINDANQSPQEEAQDLSAALAAATATATVPPETTAPTESSQAEPPISLGIAAHLWFSPPLDYRASGNYKIYPGYLKDGSSTLNSAKYTKLMVYQILVKGFVDSFGLSPYYLSGIKLKKDPPTSADDIKSSKDALIQAFKDICTDPSIMSLALSQQIENNFMTERGFWRVPAKTSFELAAFMQKVGREPVIPYATFRGPLGIYVDTYEASLNASDFNSNPDGGAEENKGDEATEEVPSTAAAPDIQADIGVTGNPADETILSVPAEPGDVSGSGLRPAFNRRFRHIRGYGINPYFTPVNGVSQDSITPRYAIFGKCVINMEKLNDNKLCCKDSYSTGYKSIYGLPIMSISNNLRNLLKELIETKQFNYVLFMRLPAEEQELMATMITKCSLPIQLPREDTDLDRFELLKGHILSGGNSREELREFKDLLFKFVRNGRVGHRAALSIIEELNDL